MMDKELLRKLISFDDTDTSSGFVSVGSGNVSGWDDVYEFDEWLRKEFLKYDILYDNCTEVFWESQDIECNFSFCEGDIIGFGIVPDADEEYGDDVDIEDDLDIRISGFMDFCESGAFIYLDYVNFEEEHDYFENELELKAYQQKIKKVLLKIRDKVWSIYQQMKNLNESLYNHIITFDSEDVSTGFNSVTGPVQKQGLFWDADYGTGIMNRQSFGSMWLSYFPERIKLYRDNMDFTISVRKPITVMVRADGFASYQEFKLEFFTDIHFSGELVYGVYPVIWYDDVVKAVKGWIPDRDNIHPWPPGVDVEKPDWYNKVIPSFEKDKQKILNNIEKKMKSMCYNNIEEYFEGDGQ